MEKLKQRGEVTYPVSYSVSESKADVGIHSFSITLTWKHIMFLALSWIIETMRGLRLFYLFHSVTPSLWLQAGQSRAFMQPRASIGPLAAGLHGSYIYGIHRFSDKTSKTKTGFHGVYPHYFCFLGPKGAFVMRSMAYPCWPKGCRLHSQFSRQGWGPRTECNGVPLEERC